MQSHYGLAALLAFAAVAFAGSAGAAEPADAAVTANGFQAGGFQVSPRVGKSTLHLNAATVRSGAAGDFDTLLSGVNLSYTLPVGPMLEIGYGSQGTWGLFGTTDKYQLREYSLAAGFQFNTPHGFVITPKVGRLRWDLSSRDSVFSHPVPGQLNNARGNQDFWELALQKRVRDVAALGVTLKDNHYDFGSVRSIAFTASFYL